MPQAIVSVASLGDNTATIAAPGAGELIQVLGGVIMAAGTVNLTFKSGSTEITGALPLSANNGFSFWNMTEVALQCNPGEALVLNLSDAVQVSGWLRYTIKG